MRKFYSNLRLSAKLLTTHLLLVILPIIVLTHFLSGQLHDITVSYTIQQEQNMSQQTRNSVNTLIEQVVNISDSVQKNDFFQNLVSGSTSENILASAANDQISAFFYTVNSLIDQSLITDICIYADLPAENLYKDQNGNASVFLPYAECKGSHWHGIFDSSSISSLFCPSFYLGPNEIADHGSLAYIKKIPLNINGTTSTLYLAVYFSQERLDTILEQSISKNNTITYIISERDNVVSSSDFMTTGVYLIDYASARSVYSSSENFVTKTILDEVFYTGAFTISNTNWMMVTMLPAKPLQSEGNYIIFNFLAFYLLFLGIAFLLATTLSRSITNRISAVITQMKSVHSGRPVPMPPSTMNDEVGDLISTYNYMSDEMNRLMDEQAKAAEELRIAEFKALQAQINPHFLYNTLDMINWLAKTNQEDKVTEAVQALSKFYKLTLNKGNTAISIKDELTQVSLYVQLQNMRYQDKIHFLVDVPDELLDYEIPKLVLQPIVENAITHGIFGKEEKEGNIVITGWHEEESLVFLVSDDGVGIPKETLDLLLTGAKAEEDTGKFGSNIAIYNTHMRLQLFYGKKDFGLTYRSEPGMGTEVEIRIPAKRYVKPGQG
ncbi:MAG: sensor histidine kinase [Eubacteriales bacterium]|nr:sensor histidine kinase [Eubacteriales bacterium]